MEAHFRKALTDRAYRRDVIFMSVGDKEVPELKLVFVQDFEDRFGIPTSVEKRGLASDFVPYKVSVDGHSLAGGGDPSEFAPRAKGSLVWKPARSHFG